MLGVLATRLCKRICSLCKESYRPSPEEYEELVEGYGAEGWPSLHAGLDDLQLFRGRGCEHCRHSGFKGRVPLHELLVGTDEIKQLIQSRTRTTAMLIKAVRRRDADSASGRYTQSHAGPDHLPAGQGSREQVA